VAQHLNQLGGNTVGPKMSRHIYDFVVLLLFFLSANKGLQSNELEMEGRRSSCNICLLTIDLTIQPCGGV
jgi:hypothetical protein